MSYTTLVLQLPEYVMWLLYGFGGLLVVWLYSLVGGITARFIYNYTECPSNKGINALFAGIGWPVIVAACTVVQLFLLLSWPGRVIFKVKGKKDASI